jgi:hypothetical protein
METIRFVVYAMNSDGVRNPKPHILWIHITPPYYKTWWFITLMILWEAPYSLTSFICDSAKRWKMQRGRLK